MELIDQQIDKTEEVQPCRFKELVTFERANLLDQNVCPTAAMVYRLHTQRCAYCNLLRERMDSIDRDLD